MKVLMLHGYTQNADTFQRKFAATQAHLERVFPSIEFHYLEAPNLLDSDDKPGVFDQRQACNTTDELGSPNEPCSMMATMTTNCRTWFYINQARDQPHGLRQSLESAAQALQQKGPFDGCIAFSQGTVIAGMVVSLLEGASRRKAFEVFQKEASDVFPYPESFRGLCHPRLKFAIFYGGYLARSDAYAWLYNHPKVQTPVCHVAGCWDPVVDSMETDAVLRAFRRDDGPILIVHPGAHSVPIAAQYSTAAANFIKSQMPCGLQGCRVRHDSIVHRSASDVPKASGQTFEGHGPPSEHLARYGVRNSSPSGDRLLQGEHHYLPKLRKMKAHSKPSPRKVSGNDTKSGKRCPCCKRLWPT